MINKKLSLLGKLGLTAICLMTCVMPMKASAEVSKSYLWDNLDTYDTNTWYESDGWSNGSMFDCTWRNDNINFKDNKMTLMINEDKKGTAPKYAGSEYRTNNFYGYGMYSVNMKPAKNVGVVSSFFTYTGPSDDNPWDEIDIEFLGKDTTKVQFNYFTNGVGNHEYLCDLGFDASESYHNYGFRWTPNYIAWFVDYKEVYRAYDNLPSTPGKIMMNLWPGTGVDEWLGHYDGKETTASYDYMYYNPYDIY